jgi:hypothetical protein
MTQQAPHDRERNPAQAPGRDPFDGMRTPDQDPIEGLREDERNLALPPEQRGPSPDLSSVGSGFPELKAWEDAIMARLDQAAAARSQAVNDQEKLMDETDQFIADSQRDLEELQRRAAVTREYNVDKWIAEYEAAEATAEAKAAEAKAESAGKGVSGKDVGGKDA